MSKYTDEDRAVFQKALDRVKKEIQITAPNVKFIPFSICENRWVVSNYGISSDFEEIYQMQFEVEPDYLKTNRIKFLIRFTDMPTTKWFNPYLPNKESICQSSYKHFRDYAQVESITHTHWSHNAMCAVYHNTKSVHKQWQKKTIRKFLRNKLLSLSNRLVDLGTKLLYKFY